MTDRRIVSLLLAALLAALLSAAVHAAESSPPAPAAPSLPVPPPESGDGLPIVLARYPGGALTRGMFRERLAKALPDNLVAFDLPESFINAEMLRRERARLELPPPDPAQADVRMKLMEREVGGRDALERHLAGVGLTYRDAWRMALRDAEFADVGRQTLRPAPRGRLTESEFDLLLRNLRRVYRPLWYGLDAPLRIARIGDGQNLTRDELVDFILREGNDLPLDRIFETALLEGLWAAEAERLGIPYTPNALAAHFMDQATPAAVERFYREHAGDLALTQMSWILVPWVLPRGGGGAPPPAEPAEPERRATLVEALKLRADLQAGGMSFEAMARIRSACPVSKGRGGVWGFVPAADWVATAVEPDAWRLDYLAEAGQRKSPIVVAPDPAVAAILPKLRDGQISDPVPVKDGYGLVLRVASRPPPPEARIREALRRWLTLSAEAKRRAELRNGTSILWSPLTSR